MHSYLSDLKILARLCLALTIVKQPCSQNRIILGPLFFLPTSCFYSDLDMVGFEQRQTIAQTVLIFFVEQDRILCPSESQPAAGDAGETLR